MSQRLWVSDNGDVLCEEHSDNVWSEITRLIDVDNF